MVELMNPNARIFNNYQKTYPNLQGFRYDEASDTLTYGNDRISLSGNILSKVDPVFFDMAPQDIFLFLKNGFYVNTPDSAHVSTLFEQIIITEDEMAYLENYAVRFIQRCAIFANNKDMLEKLSETNPNVRAFCKELMDSHRILYQAQLQTSAASYNTNAASILYRSYEAELSKLERTTAIPVVNNGTGMQESSNNLSQERGLTLERTKPGVKMNYNDFEAMEREYMESQKRLGAAGFSSIIMLLALTAIIGIYLATTLVS